jgi:hypothetical protein
MVSSPSNSIMTTSDDPCSSERSERIVGKLVITLPSVHEGGEIVIFHAGEKLIKPTNKLSEFGMSFLAW